ncbi:MAG: hypothetical protein ACKO3T_28210 [Planctomycetaceae bacterium]
MKLRSRCPDTLRQNGVDRSGIAVSGAVFSAGLADCFCRPIFFRQELAAGCDGYLRKRCLRYHSAGRRRWHVDARRTAAYVWQTGRFVGDIEFWQARLSTAENVNAVKRNTCLRFRLHSAEDFAAFRAAVSRDVEGAQWIEGTGDTTVLDE